MKIWWSGLFLMLIWLPCPQAAQDDPIVIAGNKSYAPYYYLDAQGDIVGILVDVWKLWSDKTGQKVLFKSDPLSTVLKSVSKNPNAVVAGFFYSPTREQYYEFSDPLLEIQTHIFFHEQFFGLKGLADLDGFTVGTVRDDYAEEYIRKEMPSVSLASHTTYEDLIRAAVEGKVKVFVCDHHVGRFLLSRHDHGDDFKQTTQPIYTYSLSAGVQKGNTALLNVINVGLGQITEEEKEKIQLRWSGVAATNSNTLRWIVSIGGGAMLLAAVIFMWNFQLRRRVKHATRQLHDKQAQLASSEKALQATNAELEKRVHQRTIELSTSNEKLRFQIDQHQRTTNQLANANTYLSALHDTVMGLVHRLDVEELLEAIIDHATQATGAEHGYVYLLDNTHQDDLVLRVGRGLFESAKGYRLAMGEGLAGKVLAKSHLISVSDYYKWSGRYADSLWDNLGAVVGIPLTSGSDVVGVIGLSHSKNEGQFNQGEIMFLKSFAELASIALDNAHLYSNLQKELKQRKQNEAERIQLEEKFRQAQKMEAIGTLAGGIAHDFNNILSSILGFTELAMAKLETDSSMHQYLSNVYQSGLRAKDLVQQILTFGRKSTQSTRPLFLAPIIKEAIKLMRASIPSSILIEQHIHAERLVVNANPVQIHQVLMNLSVNASYVMEEQGGTLDISLKQVTLDDGFKALNPEIDPGVYAQLTVKDTGYGMPPEVLERIFDPYFTTKEMAQGTGLGLSVVHGIVKNHGGLIKVHSDVGVGTTFEIYLPECKKLLSDQEADEQAVCGGTEHILIVDDEPALVDLNKEMLEHLGYEVTACHDSIEALDLFARQPDQYDLVLTDMTMPKLTGDKLAQSLLKIKDQLPIIIYTGFSRQISSEKAEALGIRALLMKPLVKSEMACAIRNALDGNLKPGPSDGALNKINASMLS